MWWLLLLLLLLLLLAMLCGGADRKGPEAYTGHAARPATTHKHHA